MDRMPKIALIVGSGGFEGQEGFAEEWRFYPLTPFGWPSAPIKVGLFNGVRIALVLRHGEGHTLLPSEVPYQANIYALKMLGVDTVVALTTVGSLDRRFKPGDLAIVRQMVDHTNGRPSTFFGRGIAAHVVMADPVCPHMSDLLYQTAKFCGLVHIRKAVETALHDSAVLKVMEGPAFSTGAESQMNYRNPLPNLIGMTAMPEVKLFREAEMRVVYLAIITDNDCWCERDVVSAGLVAENSGKVSPIVRKLLARVLVAFQAKRKWLARRKRRPDRCSCVSALDGPAIATDLAHISDGVKRRLHPILKRRLALGSKEQLPSISSEEMCLERLAHSRVRPKLAADMQQQ
ncbi:S-methyl-5'-thioadenosine phosphorylase [Patescibacteria group bacterium]|nr:MAG: S-methyl-5'-thioadenosine phosphorylase [Patescibacteria group bacterium]